MGGRGASYYSTRLTNRIFGNTGGQAIPIVVSKIKDKSLQGIENRIRKLNHEEAFIFDSNVQLKEGVSGGSSSVAIPNTWYNMDGAIVTHGHPSARYDFGGTLSMEDAKIMTETKWAEMRAAANGRGEYNYIMRRTSTSDNNGLRMQIIRDTPKLEKDIKAEFVNTFKKATAEGKSISAANHEAAQVATGIVQRYWRNTLPKYGFIFVTPKNDYKYGR